MEFLTDKQRENKKKHDAIVKTFCVLRYEAENSVSDSRLMQLTGKKHGYTLQGVRRILLERNIIKKRNNDRTDATPV